MRIRAFVAGLIAVSVACSSSRSASEAETALLLRSSDRVAVYDAGVQAYRAKAYPRARQLWRHAADLGDHDAASNMGFLLYYGLGGAPDLAEASAFWNRAMARGDAEAHRHVAQAILDGDPRLGSLEDAYGHALAAKRLASRPGELGGDAVARDAEELVTRARAQLSAQQLATGERLAVEWSTSASKH